MLQSYFSRSTSRDPWSRGGEDGRLIALGRVYQEMEEFGPDTEVTILRVGTHTEEVFSGKVGDTDLADLFERLKGEVLLSNPPRGTNLALMSEAAADWAARHLGHPLILRIHTDGGNDATDLASRERLKVAAKRIADAKPQGLVFVGVDSGYREGLRQSFPEASFN